MINREIRSDIPPVQTTGIYQGKEFKKPAVVRAEAGDNFQKAGNDELMLITEGVSGRAGAVSASQSAKKVDELQAAGELPRPMTAQEKVQFGEWFPKLDVESSKVTAEATWKYNCISWTVGETQQWFWPPSMYPDVTEREAFNKFYGSYSLKPSPEGEVATWRNKDGMTHGCVAYPADKRWESKCGAAARITHELKGLESDVYGWPDGFYKREGGAERMEPHEPMKVPEQVRESIAKRAGMVDPGTMKKFNQVYKLWVEDRNNPDLQMASNPKDFCRGDAYDEIVGMGPRAIPLLMEKMNDGDFFSLQVVDQIRKDYQEDHRYLMELKLSKDEVANSEQTKSAIMLTKWAQITG